MVRIDQETKKNLPCRKKSDLLISMISKGKIMFYLKGQITF